jgi:hypothetical protein
MASSRQSWALTNRRSIPEGIARPPGLLGLGRRIAPGGRPVLSPGVAGGKPGLVWDLGIVLLVPLVPIDGLVVMRSAPIKGVARNIKPHAIKPMEVSFISSSWFVRPGRFNVCGRPGFLAIPGRLLSGL